MARKKLELEKLDIEVVEGTTQVKVSDSRVPQEILEAADNFAKYNADKLFANKMEGKYKDVVKDYMINHNLEYFNASEAKIKLDCVKTEKYDEDALIAKIKELGIPGIIKTKEYVDMNALEEALYHHEIEASALKGAQVLTETYKISVKSK